MHYAKEILEKYQLRKTAAQKQAFRRWLIPQLKKLGIFAYEERCTMGAVNVIAGDPSKAQILLSAHYDTAPVFPLPNFAAPFQPLLYFGYQFLLALAILLLCGVLSFFIGFALNWPGLVMILFYVLLIASLLLLVHGPANRHTANDNSSGVALLLEIAAALPPEQRRRVAFLFFDQEEQGMRGSGGYKRKHIREIDQQLLINFDCVGDGDNLLLIPSKKSRWDGDLLTALETAFTDREKKKYVLKLQGLAVYPSDHRRFKYHVAVAAVHYKRGVGYFFGRIHTKRDTVLDPENLALLRDDTLRFLEAYRPGKK